MTELYLKQYISKIPLLAKIKKIAKQEDLDVYLVGGFLRDIYLGKPFRKNDFDFALNKKVVSFARSFAREVNGTFIMLDKVQRSVRVSVKYKGQILDYDFNKFRASTIEKDLEMRDFTVNALAVNIFDKTFRCVDPTNGLADITHKRLHTYLENNLAEDPIRLMRAFSLSALHGLSINSRTKEYIKKYCSNLDSAPFERVSEELFKILKHRHSYKFIQSMDKIGLLEKILPEINPMKGVEQGDFHHLDVWEHSLEALRCYELMYRQKLKYHTDAFAYLNEEIAQGRNRNQLLKLSCLLHDVGKPAAKDQKEGRTIFYEHDRIGVEITGKISRRFRLSVKEEMYLKLLVGMHLRPGYLADTKQPSERAVFRFFRASEGEGASVIILSLSDWRATRGPGINIKHRQSHERIMIGLIDHYFIKKKEKPVVRLLNGYEVMKILKVSGSPVIGEAIKALEEAQALGEIKTKREARLFIQDLKLKIEEGTNEN